VRKQICASCSLATECGYLRQEQTIQAIQGEGRGAVLLGVSSYVFLPAPFGKVDAVVIDESVVHEAADIIHIAYPVEAGAARACGRGGWGGRRG
jgi:hypothetical protein